EGKQQENQTNHGARIAARLGQRKRRVALPRLGCQEGLDGARNAGPDGAMSSPFARFVAASGFTNLADGIATVVWAWVATLLTRDAFLVALMPVALRLPWFLFALPAGITADRVDRKKLLQWMDVARAGAFLLATLAVLAATPLPEPAAQGVAAPGLYALLFLAALIVGTAEVFRDNAAQTMLPTLVAHADLERANGRLWSVEIVGNELLGPALGAFLIAAAVWSPFALNTAAFALAALLMTTIRGDFQPPPRQAAPWRAELREGLRFLLGSRILTALALITGFWNLLWMMITVALVLHVQENLGLGAPAYGLILAAGAVGGILGSLIGDGVIKRLGQGTTAQWMLLASFIAFALIPLAPNGWWLALVMVLFQPTGVIWNTVTVSHRQRVTPSELLGRVNSVYRLLAWGMMPVGLLLSGAIINVAEGFVAREVAITLPNWAAALGAGLLSVAGWRPLERGFRSTVTADT
ncbi:MAG: MFS transporter, partial [Pseudomonadota bacterium]